MPTHRTRLTPNTRLAALLVAGLIASIAVMWASLRPAMPGEAMRAVSALSHIFWIQIAIGFGAYAISGWVWALRPNDTATRLFLLSGIATMLFTYAPTPVRESIAPIPDGVFVALTMLNAGGASLFGIAMSTLFICYPARLPRRGWLVAGNTLFFAGWTAIGLYGTSHGRYDSIYNVHLITTIEMLVICLAVLAQILATGRDPKARAVAIWFGLAVLFGAGGFITMTAIPSVFGIQAFIKAQYSFAFFLLIYIGVAAGLQRFRLFELGDWAYRILFYAAGAILLLAVDAVLVSLVALEPGSAFGISLLAIALAYLPLRDVIGRRVLPRPGLKQDELFLAVVDIAFGTSDRSRHHRWRALLDRLFTPLEIVEADRPVDEPEIREEGIEMRLPSTPGHPALILRHPWRGRALFSPDHLATARKLIELMAHAEESRRAYDRGVAEERHRIARDMHDNIGAQLLGALHSGDYDRKDLMIRETLTDLRDIINNAATPGLDLDETLADLRMESAERLASVGIELDWRNEIGQAPELSTSATHALRSIVREAVSNTIRHSGAKRLDIRLKRESGRACLDIADDGQGFDRAAVASGNGLSNMQSRTESLGGKLACQSNASGTHITVRFPLNTHGAQA
ncbi:MAG: ATP-binding protein [Pseudomonadota bacterium]|nr:ATP-binding protein [Pseudomonadota bacterium]